MLPIKQLALRTQQRQYLEPEPHMQRLMGIDETVRLGRTDLLKMASDQMGTADQNMEESALSAAAITIAVVSIHPDFYSMLAKAATAAALFLFAGAQ
jgi:hypothetical protein